MKEGSAWSLKVAINCVVAESCHQTSEAVGLMASAHRWRDVIKFILTYRYTLIPLESGLSDFQTILYTTNG